MVDVNLILKLLLDYNLDTTLDVGAFSVFLKTIITLWFSSQIYGE